MLYLINYASSLKYSTVDIHETIKNSKLVLDWWHYLPYTYIIYSHNTTKELTDNIFGKRILPYFITRIYKKDMGGLLPKQAWEWLQQHGCCKNMTLKGDGKMNMGEFYMGTKVNV